MALRDARTSRTSLIALALASVALFGMVLYPFASALLFAAVLAGAFHPWMERAARLLGGRRELAAALLTLAVAVLLVLPTTLLTVSLGRQVVEAVAFVGDTLQKGGVPALLDHLPPAMKGAARSVLDHMPRGEEKIQELADGQTGRAAAAVGGVLKAMSGVLFQTLAMLVAFFFLLVDGPRLVDWVGRVAPFGEERTRELLSDFRSVSVAVLASSVATAGAQAAAALVGFLLAGVPQPVFFAALTFVVAFIPAVGATSVTLGLSALLLVTGRTPDALLLLVWGLLVVSTVDNLLKPILMRGRIEIHGAVIFFALLGGLAMFGPVGLVADPLILSFFLAMVRIWHRDLRRTA